MKRNPCSIAKAPAIHVSVLWNSPTRLLADGGRVRVLDNFSTGSAANLAFAEAHGTRLEIVQGDIRDLPAVERAVGGVDVIFHQAAMRAVPRSLAPIPSARTTTT